MQFVYSDGLQPIRGNTFGRDSLPDVDIALSPGDQIVGAFGYFDTQCCINYIFVQLGFRAASGAQYGPYGGKPLSSQSFFALPGRVYGVFGGLVGSSSTVGAFGVWTDSPSPPPAPPARPPPPSSNSPTPPPLYNSGRIRAYSFGYWNPSYVTYWDDSPNRPGMSEPLAAGLD